MWKKAAEWGKQALGTAWKSGLKGAEAWTREAAPYWLNRAAQGAMVGGAIGAGTNVLTGIASSVASTVPYSPFTSDWSFGSVLGSGIRGAAIGGIMGGAAMNARGSLRPWAAQAMRGASGLGRIIAPDKTSALASRIYGALPMASESNLVAKQIRASIAPPKNFDSQKWFGNRAVQVKDHLSGSVKANLGSSLIAGGVLAGSIGSLYGSSALGLTVPSNYGYR